MGILKRPFSKGKSESGISECDVGVCREPAAFYLASLQEGRRGNYCRRHALAIVLSTKRSKNLPAKGQPSEKFPCPCCGYETLDERPPGTFDICPICFWEDDNLQFSQPDYEDGANRVSLRQAQRNFLDFGAVEQRALMYARKPTEKDKRNPNWKPL